MRCRHGHPYLVHYNCYLKEHPERMDKIGFFDIETTNLKADFGIILCYAIKPLNTSKILQRSITKKELVTGELDANVVRSCIKDMEKFDRLIGYYSKRFDAPFIRTRAVQLGIPFPAFGSIIHEDVYFIVRHRFCLSSNRLENAARVLCGNTEKNRIESKYWIAALQGNKIALDYIQDHNRRDVRDLEKLYKKVYEFTKPKAVSL
jgi:uncharacterized protein YprB with RNaseH-like and TPR domain